MKKTIITTSWDDGHKYDMRIAKLLKKYDLQGTFYVSPMDRELDKKNLLTNSEVKILSRDFEIGAHTMTHPRLTGVDTSEANTEITESKKYLEKLIGKKVVSFCYPGGKYSPINVKQVRKAGYKIARTTKTFKLNMDKNVFETPTSVHAYDHYTDIYKILIFIKFNPIKFLRLYLHWDNLAKEMFDKVLENGGVFHLWGHSWEIHGHKDWNRLEKVFEYISKRKNAKYVTNGKLI